MPDVHIEGPSDVPVIEVLKGCLYLSHRQGTQFLVWRMKEFGVATSWTPLLNINYEGLHFYVPYDMPIIPVILSISHNDNFLVFGSYGNAEFHLYNKKDNSIYSFELFKENNFSCFSYDYV